MTLEETIRTLEAVALQQQSVAMVIDNDIFKLNTIPNAKYAVFAYTQGEHLTSVSGDLATYRLTLFYVDRLLADKSNQTQIQSTGTQVLRNILTMMSELDFQVDNMPIQPFTQQFVDECAGVYCSVAIGAANGCECMPGFTEVLRKLNAASDKANEATKKAEDEAARVRALADNPPKIVEVEGAKYWAFWDEETGQYVVSENRADVGDAVLFSPQVLTPQQQEQARKNIGILSSPSRSFVDLRPIIGTDCWAVYRFDDTGYYILHNGGFTKLSLDFSKIYSVNCPGLYDRESSFNLCCKIGNRVFVSPSNETKLIYMYDEDTDQGSYLENPADLQYYGNIYAIDGKLYRFHSYNSTDIYVYDADGQFVQHVMNEHGRIKYTEGTAFTSDGYKVNLSDFTFEPLSFPIEFNGDFNWVFGNGNILKAVYGISSNNNTQAYIFSEFIGNLAGLAISNSDVYAILYTTYGKFIYTYPYGLSNPTHRQQRIDPPYGRLVIRKATIYGDEVYITTKDSILIIENIRCYATD